MDSSTGEEVALKLVSFVNRDHRLAQGMQLLEEAIAVLLYAHTNALSNICIGPGNIDSILCRKDTEHAVRCFSMSPRSTKFWLQSTYYQMSHHAKLRNQLTARSFLLMVNCPILIDDHVQLESKVRILGGMQPHADLSRILIASFVCIGWTNWHVSLIPDEYLLCRQ